MLKNVSQIGIVVSKMRGQGYDGAAAMSGRLNGAQVHIREVIPTALDVYCAAHSLNLTVSNSCSNQCLRPYRRTCGAVSSRACRTVLSTYVQGASNRHECRYAADIRSKVLY